VSCSTYERRRGVYRILVRKPDRKRPTDIMQLVTTTVHVVILKLLSKFHFFLNLTCFAVKVKKVHMWVEARLNSFLSLSPNGWIRALTPQDTAAWLQRKEFPVKNEREPGWKLRSKPRSFGRAVRSPVTVPTALHRHLNLLMEVWLVYWTAVTEYRCTTQWNFTCTVNEMQLDDAVSYTREQKKSC
jgi:hypothetical protein